MSVGGKKIGFGERPAVLVVDLLNAFTDPELPLGSDLDSVVDATADLLESARRTATPVIFVGMAYEDPNFTDAGLWGRKVNAEALRAGPDVEVDARLARRPEEQLIVKHYASSFFGTDLASRLSSQGVDTLVICGCATSGCIRATVVDAIQHGFRPIVVEEAVGDRSPEGHRQSLLDIDLKYGDVVQSREAVAQIAASAA